MDAKQKGSKPKLQRRNAVKNIDYDASSSSSSSSSLSFSEQSPNLRTRSLDLSPLSDNKTSFRIKGIEGEFDLICRTLGFSGPEDFAIPTAVWEAQKARSASDISARLLKDFNSPKVDPDILRNDVVSEAQFEAKVRVTSDFEQEFESSKLKKNSFGNRGVRVCDEGCVGPSNGEIKDGNEFSTKLKNGLVGVGQSKVGGGGGGAGGGGIKGERPPVLAPPPVKLPLVVDNVSSTWDILKSFAPQEEDEDLVSPVRVGFIGHLDEEDRVIKEIEVVNEERLNGVRLEESDDVSPTCTSTSDGDDDDDDDDNNDGGDVFDVIVEPVYSISPHGKFRLTISSWQKGELLGSGSFGTVYEGFTE